MFGYEQIRISNDQLMCGLAHWLTYKYTVGSVRIWQILMGRMVFAVQSVAYIQLQRLESLGVLGTSTPRDSSLCNLNTKHTLKQTCSNHMTFQKPAQYSPITDCIIEALAALWTYCLPAGSTNCNICLSLSQHLLKLMCHTGENWKDHGVWFLGPTCGMVHVSYG